MTSANRWLLPDGVEEILPPQARNLELLRREILDLYQSWGYDLVITPLIEFLDSLLIVPSSKLQLRTFKILDQISGRSMGVRADITSQVARIDAHVLKHEGPCRLCYADSVLHTTPSTLLGSRSPIRIGAELYGHAGLDSDVEVISLMLQTLAAAGIEKSQLALGHVSIYRGLIARAALAPELERRLFKALQRKAEGEIDELLDSASINGELKAMLTALVRLSGDRSVLDEAETVLAKAPQETLAAIRQLGDIADAISARHPQQSLYFDLAELRGYEYHTGVVFATYVNNYGEALAKGGRYDHIGEVFGRARAATGFDTDLKTLLALSRRAFPAPARVFAPAGDDAALQAKIQALRATGTSVVIELKGQKESARELGCTQTLVFNDGQWQLQDLV